MTEEEWLEDLDLRSVHHLVGLGLATDRKLWLLSVGQCRCLWHLLDDWERETVELAEQCADGPGGRRKLEARFHQVDDRPEPENGWWPYTRFCVKRAAHTERLVKKGGYESWQGVSEEDEVGTTGRASLVGPVNSFASSAEYYAGGDSFAMQQRIHGVFRDVFGNPFRPVAPDPKWLTGPVRSLARTIYRSQAFERMPELADALERAGCPSPDLIAHFREPGEHVRGCWALDLLLGKR